VHLPVECHDASPPEWEAVRISPFNHRHLPKKSFDLSKGTKKLKNSPKQGTIISNPPVYSLFSELGKATLEPAKRTAFSFWDKRWNENRPDLIMKRLYLNFFMGRSRG